MQGDCRRKLPCVILDRKKIFQSYCVNNHRHALHTRVVNDLATSRMAYQGQNVTFGGYNASNKSLFREWCIIVL